MGFKQIPKIKKKDLAERLNRKGQKLRNNNMHESIHQNQEARMVIKVSYHYTTDSKHIIKKKVFNEWLVRIKRMRVLQLLEIERMGPSETLLPQHHR